MKTFAVGYFWAIQSYDRQVEINTYLLTVVVISILHVVADITRTKRLSSASKMHKNSTDFDV